MMHTEWCDYLHKPCDDGIFKFRVYTTVPTGYGLSSMAHLVLNNQMDRSGVRPLLDGILPWLPLRHREH